ncbi:MAG: glycoside hydrolase family 25 [Lachnospiraceae bacterium]|jgi:lysozyme|nr:glycoside hydrolase family 25 [Lachnospiraceae bacterium]
MNKPNRAKTQPAVIAVVLTLILFITAGLLLFGGQEENTQTAPSPVGETLTSGSRENSPGESRTSGPDSEGFPADDIPGDPQRHKKEPGAEASLEDPSGQGESDISLGIDVSKWQGRIDWELAAASGVDFAMIRVGFRSEDTGEISADPYAAYNLQHASEAGILLGAYFFSTAVTEEEAALEAAWTADFLAGYPVTYPVAYNCEGFFSPDSRMYGISAEQRTLCALAFLKAMQEAGYETLFHASRSDLAEETAWLTDRIEAVSPIWVAQYPARPYPDTAASSYEGNHTMWQYTSQGTVPGIDAYVDLNVAYFAYDEAASPRNPGAAAEADDVPIDSTFQITDELVTAKEVTNLRSEPSTVSDDTIAASLTNGEWIRRTGISTRGWSRVEYGGQTLYAISSLLMTEEEAENQPAGPTAPSVSTVYQAASDSVTAKTETNLRDGAGTEGTLVVATIKNGEWVNRTGIGSNGWSRLDYNGQTLYALTSYLTTDADFDPADVDSRNIVWTPCDDTMTAKEKTNLRDKPTTEDDSQVIATIYSGDLVTRTAIGSNGWSRVIYEGQTLYAVTSLLTESGEGR